MSDDFDNPPAEEPSAKPARKRPAPRKAAKAKPPKGAEAGPAAETPVEARQESPSLPFESRDPAPEPIPFFVETTNAEPPGNSKKRRRRKKKHGQGQSQQHPQASAPSADFPPAAAHESPAPVMHAAPRPKLDADEVARKAWRIFRSEVGEEGLALIDDHDAREISRRCFRLAEIFLEEAARRNR